MGLNDVRAKLATQAARASGAEGNHRLRFRAASSNVHDSLRATK